MVYHLNVNCRIPSDPSAATLPLSTSYRNTLRTLCNILGKENAKLPSEVERKRKSIEKMCSKLEADDAVSSSGGFHFGSKKLPKWVFPLCAFAGVCYIGYKKYMTMPRGGVTATVDEVNKAREARLRKFKES